MDKLYEFKFINNKGDLKILYFYNMIFKTIVTILQNNMIKVLSPQRKAGMWEN